MPCQRGCLRSTAQVVIQPRELAEAVKRIKAAVSPATSPAQRPPAARKGPRAVPSAAAMTMLRTELSGVDHSTGGAPHVVLGARWHMGHLTHSAWS